MSQRTAYGGLPTGDANGRPSTRKRTERTGTPSWTTAVNGMGPDTTWWGAGLTTESSGGGAEAGVTSTAAMFHWSVVGAVSSIVTGSPAAVLVPEDPCTQKVSPSVESTHWSMIDCPVSGVRAMALSQSAPREGIGAGRLRGDRHAGRAAWCRT